MIRRLFLCAVALLCTLSKSGFAQNFPSEVLDEASELDGVCLDHGGRPGRTKWIKTANIGLDQIDVWILDEGRYICEGGVLWPGHSGSGISVYARLQSGQIKKVFSIVAGLAAFESEGSGLRIWIYGWGNMCRLPEPESDADWPVTKSCQRPLDWDPRSERMVFAPLSEARFSTMREVR